MRLDKWKSADRALRFLPEEFACFRECSKTEFEMLLKDHLERESEAWGLSVGEHQLRDAVLHGVNLLTLGVAWTTLDDTAGRAEGWCLAHITSEQEAAWELQHVGLTFKQDEDAWVHVRTKAAEGSALHVKALAFLLHVSPSEHAEILAQVFKEQPMVAPKNPKADPKGPLCMVHQRGTAPARYLAAHSDDGGKTISAWLPVCETDAKAWNAGASWKAPIFEIGPRTTLYVETERRRRSRPRRQRSPSTKAGKRGRKK